MFKKILIANRGEIACRVMRTAKRVSLLLAAAYGGVAAPVLATSCRGPDIEATAQDFVSICVGGLRDRRRFDAALNASTSAFQPMPELTTWTGRNGRLQLQEGWSCSLTLSVFRSREVTEQIVAAVSHELGLPPPAGRIDPTGSSLTYSWPRGGVESGHTGVRAIVLLAARSNRPRPPMLCNYDDMTITALAL